MLVWEQLLNSQLLSSGRQDEVVLCILRRVCAAWVTQVLPGYASSSSFHPTHVVGQPQGP